jgi:hypothetical protein
MRTSKRAKTFRFSFVLLLALAAFVTACQGGSNTPAYGEEQPDLSVGVFGECDLPSPLRPLLDEVGQLLLGKGVDIEGEAILVYDHDLQCGGNSLELLVGGSAAWSLGAALGLGEDELHGLLNEVSATTGLLISATVGLDFDGSWEGIQFAVDGYAGGDILGTGGGTWKILWSTDPSEVGETGFWASITVGSDGACSAGGVVFGTDGELGVLKSAWDSLTGSGSDAGSSSRGCPSADGGSGPPRMDGGAGDGGGAGPDGSSIDPDGGASDGGAADDWGSGDDGGDFDAGSGDGGFEDAGF